MSGFRELRELMRLVHKGAGPALTRGEWEVKVGDLAEDMADAWELSGRPLTKAQAYAAIHKRHPELYEFGQSLPPGEPTAPVAKSQQDELASEIVWRRIEKYIEAQLAPDAATLPSQQYAIKKTAKLSEFLTKDPTGRKLYALYERAGSRTLSQLDQDSPLLGSEVRKLR